MVSPNGFSGASAAGAGSSAAAGSLFGSTTDRALITVGFRVSWSPCQVMAVRKVSRFTAISSTVTCVLVTERESRKMVSGAFSSVSGSDGGVSSDGGSFAVSTATRVPSVLRFSTQSVMSFRQLRRSARLTLSTLTSIPGMVYFTCFRVRLRRSPST